MKKKNYLFAVFGVFACLFGYAQQPLIISYVTTQLGNVPNAVAGVLVTPSGQVLKTAPLGPYSQYNLLINPPEIGTYSVYFEALQPQALRLCPIVGGFGVTIGDYPDELIPLTPNESRIQAFSQGKQTLVGSSSQPVAYFQITQEDLQ